MEAWKANLDRKLQSNHHFRAMYLEREIVPPLQSNLGFGSSGSEVRLQCVLKVCFVFSIFFFDSVFFAFSPLKRFRQTFFFVLEKAFWSIFLVFCIVSILRFSSKAISCGLLLLLCGESVRFC